MNSRLVLMVAADPSLQHQLAILVRKRGYEPVLVGSVEEANAALAHNQFQYTVLDADFASPEGLASARRLQNGGDPGPIIALSSDGEGRDGGEAVSLLADEIVRKPFTDEQLNEAVRRALARAAELSRPTFDDPIARLRQEIGLWRGAKMQAVLETVRQAARVDVTVLICGETGTGKDVVARAIYHLSSRRDQPFIRVNCAAVPRELLESELFGHERGAFTGAHQLKLGKFELANRGTIFLDEIADLHPALQAKLLQVLQDGTFSRVGGKATLREDVRVLAATNRDLERAVAEGRFRDDLFYRLNVIQIVVPPLRERPEEIPLLAEYFVQRYLRFFKRPRFQPDGATMERLNGYHYPGNVRELENIIKRMIVLDDPLLVKAPRLASRVGEPEVAEASRPDAGASLKEIARRAARAAEREAIARALNQTGWNRARAAKLLKISYRALLYKIKDVGLDPDRAAS